MCEDVIVMVLSFDKYNDLWDVYFQCVAKYWKASCPNYLVTNDLDPDYKNVNVLQTGKEISWSHRVRKAVEQVKSDYIILMLEDYFVLSEVTDATLLPLIEFMKKVNGDYLRIYPFPRLKFRGKEGCNRIHALPNNSLYGVNLQPAIWKKSFLIKLLGDDDFSAWEFEARQKNGKETRVDGKLFVVDYYPFCMVNGVLQGKWYPPSIKQLKKSGINIVANAKRSVLPWKKVLLYKAKIRVRYLLGPTIIRYFKPLLKKLGVRFVTD